MRAGRRVTVPLVGSERAYRGEGSERAYRGEGSERAYRGEGEHENQTRVHVATQGRAQQHTGGAASPLLTSGFAGAARHEKEENEQYVWCVVLSLHDFARMLSRRMHSPLSPLKNNQAHTQQINIYTSRRIARGICHLAARALVWALSRHTLLRRAPRPNNRQACRARRPRATRPNRCPDLSSTPQPCSHALTTLAGRGGRRRAKLTPAAHRSDPPTKHTRAPPCTMRTPRAIAYRGEPRRAYRRAPSRTEAEGKGTPTSHSHSITRMPLGCPRPPTASDRDGRRRGCSASCARCAATIDKQGAVDCWRVRTARVGARACAPRCTRARAHLARTSRAPRAHLALTRSAAQR